MELDIKVAEKKITTICPEKQMIHLNLFRVVSIAELQKKSVNFARADFSRYPIG